MKITGQKSAPTIGFLTVLRHSSLGVIGGLLVTHPHGRPVEFHCTAPVKPDRAQQILYGRTLAPFLYGEQIARTLLDQVSVQPYVVLTDVAPVLSVRPLVRIPVALLLDVDRPSANETPAAWDRDPSDGNHHGALPFQTGSPPLAVAADYPQDRQQIVAHWDSWLGGMDPREPFDRIREAINEAQRAA